MYGKESMHTLFPIKPIRVIPRHMLQPLLIRLIKCSIHFSHRNSNSRVVEQVPESRVAEPLGADDPGFWPVADPGRDGHEEGVDVA